MIPIPPSRAMAIARRLSVTVLLDREAALPALRRAVVKPGSAAMEFIKAACEDAYDRLIYPSLEREARSALTDSANEGARIASFVSVAPIDDPKVAVLVCLDEPHSWTTSGGALSGPVCAEVLGKVLPYLGVERESGE